MGGRSLKILMIVHGFPPEFTGGTELYALELARGLNAAGHVVHGFVGSMEGRDVPEIEKDEYEGVAIHRVHRQGLFVDNWDKSYAPEVEALLKDVLDEFKPDVVHVHHWVRLTRSLVMACVEAGVPAVVTSHDTWTSCPRCFRIRDEKFCERELSVPSCLDCVPRDPWHGDQELGVEIELFRDDFRQELRLAHRVIAPSEAHRSLVARTTGLSSDRIIVVPHGTITRLSPMAPSTETGKVRIGHWGHLFPMKGFHLVLEAARLLSEEYRQRLAITCWGESPSEDYREQLDQLADGLDVTWKGAFRQEDLGAAELDWAVFPSMAHESYSFVLDEAFALGLPVIVSDRGALGSRVGDAGLRFAAESADDLATVLRRLLTEPGLTERCRGSVPALMPMSDHVEVLVDLYREVIEEGPTNQVVSRDLLDRHRVHRSYRMDRRIRQLMESRGRVEQESDRASGLEVEFRKAEEVLEAREAHISSLERSVAGWETEVARVTFDLEQGRAGYEALEAAHLKLVDEHQGLAAELDEGRRHLHEQLDAAHAATGTAKAAREAVEEKLSESRAALDAYRDVVGKLEKDVVAARGRSEEARREQSALELRVEGLQAEIGVQRERIEEAYEQREAAELLSAECVEERDQSREQQGRLEKLLNDEKAHAAALADEKTALGGRAVQLQTELQGLGSKAEDVFGNLAGLARELGVDPAVAGVGAVGDRLATLLDVLMPVIIESRNLMGEMARSVEAVSTEAQLIEEERGRLAAALVEEERARSARRRHLWYRWAEKLAGGATEPGGPTAPRASGGSDRGLRVLMVVHDFLPRHPAGTEIYTYRLASALMTLGAKVHIVYTEAKQGVHSYYLTHGEYEGVPFTEISHQHTTRYFERTYRDPQMERVFEGILDEFQPSIVHCQHLHHHSIGYVPIAKQRGLPVVYTLHEYMLLCPRGGQMLREDLEICERPVPEKCADCIAHLSLEPAPSDEGRARLASRVGRHLPHGLKEGLKRLASASSGEFEPAAEVTATPEEYVSAIEKRLEAVKEVADQVDLFISPSAFLRQKFIDCGMAAPERIIASDNGQDDSPFTGIRRTRADVIRLGFIGTICDYKGVHVVIDAMNQVVDLEGVTCDIFGSLDSFPDYARQLPDRVRNPRTQLRGKYAPQEVGRVLSELDAIIVPSLWYENSPLTIHEAFMAGIPVIASNLGGMAEYVHHGENGLLFEVGNGADLAARIREIVADRDLLERLRNHAVEIKTIDRDARDMETRYRRLMAGQPAVEESTGP